MTVTTAPEAAMYASRVDGTQAFGGAAHVIFQAGVNGGVFDTQIKRYARNIQASGGGGGGYTIIRNHLEPRALIDPKYGPGSCIIRVRDCLAVTFPNGVPGSYPFTQLCSTFWGLSGTQGGGAGGTGVTGNPFVGFVATPSFAANTAVAIAPNVWRCVVTNDALASLYDVATTISPLAPHEFQLVLDGTTSTIYWYIDGVQVGSYSPASGAAPGQVTPYANAGGSAADRWNLAWAHSNTGSSGAPPFVSRFLSRMSPFTALVTVEYAD